jgi:hypothetical protein
VHEWSMSAIRAILNCESLRQTPSSGISGEKSSSRFESKFTWREGLRVPCQNQTPEMDPCSLPFYPPWGKELVQVALVLGQCDLFLTVSERPRETGCPWRGRPARRSRPVPTIWRFGGSLRLTGSPAGLFAPVIDAVTKLGETTQASVTPSPWCCWNSATRNVGCDA